MKKWIRKIMMAVMAVMMVAAPVRAAAENESVLYIPVTWQKNDLLSERKYTVTLSAVTSDAPMPQGSVDGVDSVVIEDAAASGLQLQIRYKAPAEYWYKLTAERNDDRQIIASYALHVMVTNGPNGSLEANMTVRQGSQEGIKVDQIVLKDDEPRPSASPAPTPTPEPSNSPSPSVSPEPSDSPVPVPSPTPAPSASSTSVLTGVTSSAGVWIFLLAASMIVLLIAGIRRKDLKNSKNDK